MQRWSDEGYPTPSLHLRRMRSFRHTVYTLCELNREWNTTQTHSQHFANKFGITQCRATSQAHREDYHTLGYLPYSSYAFLAARSQSFPPSQECRPGLRSPRVFIPSRVEEPMSSDSDKLYTKTVSATSDAVNATCVSVLLLCYC